MPPLARALFRPPAVWAPSAVPPRDPMMAFDSRSTPEPRTISAATRSALAAAVVRLWNDPSRWRAEGNDGRRVQLDAALVAAVDRTVREAQSRSLRAEEVIVAFKDLLGELPELLVPERRLEAAHFRERLITECIRAYYAR